MKSLSTLLFTMSLLVVTGCGSGGNKESDKQVTEKSVDQKVDSVSENMIREIESASENIKKEATEVEEKVNKLLEDI